MEMREAAEAYCRVIEAARGSDRMSFVNDVAVSLSAAIAAAYRLLDVDFESESAVEDSDESISDEQWHARMKDIQGVVGDWDNYWTTFDAYRLDNATGLPDLGRDTFEEKVANLSLADALADIWRDLRNGLDSLGRGVALDEVQWDWRFNFRIHWGAHAVEALRAIHQQVTD